MLNKSQLSTLKETLKVAVGGVIDAGFSSWLPRCIEENKITIEQLKRYFTPEYISQINQNVNIPENIRTAWSSFAACILSDNQVISKDVLDALKSNPNYNPFNLAAMHKFEQEVAEIKNESARSYLIRLREAYLEMTPTNQYSYGNRYAFQFRIGNVPFNLDHFGPKPNNGEIQEYIEGYIQDRIEIQLEHEKKLKGLIEKNKQLENRINETKNESPNNGEIQEYTEGYIQDKIEIKPDLEKKLKGLIEKNKQLENRII